MFDFTPNTALEFLTLLSPLLPVLATYLTVRTEWSKELRFGVSFLATLIVAFLTAYANGQINGSFWSSLAQTFTIAQGIYWGVFKTLGLEKALFPREALQSVAAEPLKDEMTGITRAQAVDILDTSKPPTLNVSANVIQKTGDVV
jgi:hypothetical protein